MVAWLSVSSHQLGQNITMERQDGGKANHPVAARKERGGDGRPGCLGTRCPLYAPLRVTSSSSLVSIASSSQQRNPLKRESSIDPVISQKPYQLNQALNHEPSGEVSNSNHSRQRGGKPVSEQRDRPGKPGGSTFLQRQGAGYSTDNLLVRSRQGCPAQFLFAVTGGRGYCVRILSVGLRQICISVLNLSLNLYGLAINYSFLFSVLFCFCVLIHYYKLN